SLYILYRHALHAYSSSICQPPSERNHQMYSGESGHFNARLPIELINRLEARAQDLQITKSMLVRTLLAIVLLTRDELAERVNSERHIQQLIRAEMKDNPNA